MVEEIEFQGVRVTANFLVERKAVTSWPDIYSTNVGGASLRWQYANESGPCAKSAADRIVIPFVHGGIRKGTELALNASQRR
jgi:hypothetical protein